MSKNTNIADLINYISVDGSGNVVLTTGGQVATQSYVTTAVSNLVNSAPSTLDTLNELATALGNDANFATTVTTSIATRLPLAGGTLTGALNGTSATFSGLITANAGLLLGTSQAVGATGTIGFNSTQGVYIYAKTGSAYDFKVYNGVGSTFMQVPTGTQNVEFLGSVASTRLNVSNAFTEAINISQTSGSTTKGHLGQFSDSLYISNNYFYNGVQSYDDTSKANSSIEMGTGFIYFKTGAANITPGTKMTITLGGDIGIGNSAFASTRLTITGKSTTSSDFSFVANNSANSNLFLVRNDGNVGIGTNPDFKLDVNGVTQIRDTLITTKQVGFFYGQTSGSGSTSFVNTGIFYNTSIIGFVNNGTYFLAVTGNPNGAGSGEYRAVYLGYITVTTGYDFGITSVVQRINYTQIVTSDAFNIGALTVSVVFWNGTTETTQQVNGTTNNQIRIKISGYNGSNIGAAQDVRITKIN
jgi:hypothetical protein